MKLVQDVAVHVMRELACLPDAGYDNQLMGLLLTVIAVQFILNGLRPYLAEFIK